MSMEFVAINFFCTQSTEPEISESESSEMISESQSQFTSESQQDSVTNLTDSDSSSRKSERSSASTRKSSLHNMQKHLFTFILSCIPRTRQDISEMSQVELCARELFGLLKSEKRKTKESLQPVFGEYNERRLMNSPQYSYLLDKYCRSTLLTARELCKDTILKKLAEDQIELYIRRSKASKKEQFQEYLKNFREEIICGSFGLRISHKGQKRIKEETEWTKVLDLN